MTPLPPPLGSGGLVLWRLDELHYAATWDSGEGAYRFGGRWNSLGHRVVYGALDPATAILEVAVHKTFRLLDTIPHVMTAAAILQIDRAHVVYPTDVPNPNWLRPCAPSAGQQEFGDRLVQTHVFVLIPSAVSTRSWNVIFDPARAAGLYGSVEQERFALDTRLHLPGTI